MNYTILPRGKKGTLNLVTRVNGRQVWKSLRTTDPKEAARRAKDFMGRADQGEITEAANMKLKDYLEEFLELYARVNVQDTTRESYEIAINKHLSPALGHLTLGELTPVHVQRYMANKVGEGLSNTTVRYHHKVLRKALNVATDWGYVVRNVALKATPPKPNDFEYAVWSVEESKRFLDCLGNDRNFALYATVLLTGMRRGEVLGLKWRDINWETQTISIRRQIVNTQAGVVVKSVKTDRSKRPITIGPRLVQILTDHRERQVAERLQAKVWTDNDWVFPNREGRYTDPNNLARRHFKRVIRESGVTNIRFHDLRHTHITHLLESGVHLKVASERAGHSSVSITGDIYSHVTSPVQSEAALLSEGRLLG